MMEMKEDYKKAGEELREITRKANAYDSLKAQNKALESVVKFIANDYAELSHDKVLWQRNHYIKMCREVLAKELTE